MKSFINYCKQRYLDWRASHQPPQLATLTAHYQWVQRLIKQTRLADGKAINKCPYVLVIGPSDAGKSTLLQMAELGHIIQTPFIQSKPQGMPTLGHSNWWLTPHAIFIDVPGWYFASSEQSLSPWTQLIRLLSHGHKPLAEIILVFDLPALAAMPSVALHQTLATAKRALEELLHQHKNSIQASIVFTQLDKLTGFNEFFDDLGYEERIQCWGMEFNEQPSFEEISNQFDQFLQLQHDRVIWRIQQVRDLAKCNLIKDFPLQLECCRAVVCGFGYLLAELCRHHPQFRAHGMYFTSSMQPQTPTTDLLLSAMKNSLALPTTQISLPVSSSRAYFSRELLASMPKKTQTPLAKTRFLVSNYRYYFALLAIILLSGLALSLWGYQQQKQGLAAVQRALTSYQKLATPTPGITSAALLPTLNLLATTIKDLTATQEKRWLPYQAPNLLAQTRQLYQRLLSNQFTPYLQATLEHALQSTDQNPAQTYDSFKTYLMLGLPAHRQPEVIRAWFTRYWEEQQPKSPALVNTLVAHLNNTLPLMQAGITLNQTLITNLRQRFRQLPEAVLINAVLQSQASVQLIPLTQAETQVKIFKENIKSLPTIYTAKQLPDIYLKRIPQACQQLNEESWLFGTTVTCSNSLIQAAQKFYLADYIDYWQQLATKLPLRKVDNLKQAIDLLHTLGDPKHSPMLHLLQQIIANTASFGGSNNSAAIAAASREINQHFKPLHTLWTSQQGIAILANFTQLANWLQKIEQAANPQLAAYQTAQKRFLHPQATDPLSELTQLGENMPAPLKQWLQDITASCWKLLLQQTHHYINQRWQSEIWPYYQAHLANRYPLVKSASQDIDLTAFSRFFAPQGMMNRFFKDYLQAFADTHQPQWQWRQLQGLGLEISPQVLVEFERASSISHMFFNQGKLHTSFSLLPLAVAPEIQQLHVSYQNHTTKLIHTDVDIPLFHWPSAKSQDSVKLSFQTVAGEVVYATEVGPWAWFKIFDKAKLQTTGDTQHFKLLFEINGSPSNYGLVVSRAVNPFIPGITQQFRCTEKLD